MHVAMAVFLAGGSGCGWKEHISVKDQSTNGLFTTESYLTINRSGCRTSCRYY